MKVNTLLNPVSVNSEVSRMSIEYLLNPEYISNDVLGYTFFFVFVVATFGYVGTRLVTVDPEFKEIGHTVYKLSRKASERGMTAEEAYTHYIAPHKDGNTDTDFYGEEVTLQDQLNFFNLTDYDLAILIHNFDYDAFGPYWEFIEAHKGENFLAGDYSEVLEWVENYTPDFYYICAIFSGMNPEILVPFI